MAKFAKSKTASYAVYGVLGLLVLSLGGFGVTSFGGSAQSVASVGDREVGVNEYARAVNNELSRLSQQFGQQITLEQARAFGVVDNVLQQLLSQAAVDNEVARLGFSIGDEEVRKQILEIPAFQSLGGQFDKVNYEERLRSSGLSTKEFENNLRIQTARTFLQGAVGGGVIGNTAYGDAIIDFLTQERNFEWAVLDASALSEEVLATDADLQTYYDENPATFTLPESRQITYAVLLPETVAATIEVPASEIQAVYDERAAEFQKPERRLTERLAFADEAAANAAKARLDSGEVRFADLLAERDLTLEDVDMGEVTRDDLYEETANALFADGFLGVAGPLPSSVGPAIFRVNGALAAIDTPLEDVQDDIRSELAQSRARREILDYITEVDDLLAGGATLEEVAAETQMTLETTDITTESAEDMAAYNEFRAAALSAQDGDFPEITELSDGGIFALRLDGITPPTLQDIEAVTDQLNEAWTYAETQIRLNTLADEKAAALEGDVLFADQGLRSIAEVNLRRDGTVAGTPPTTVFEAFNLELGQLTTIDGVNEVYIVRLNAINTDTQTEEDEGLSAIVANEVNGSLSNDIYAAFTNAVRADAGVSINTTAVNAVLTQLATNGGF